MFFKIYIYLILLALKYTYNSIYFNSIVYIQYGTVLFQSSRIIWQYSCILVRIDVFQNNVNSELNTLL